MNAAEVVGLVGAGAVGAPARYLVGAWVSDRTVGAFPWGTLIVNLSGSLVLGVLTGLALYHALPQAPRVVVGTGFCGAYTTFSAFSFETVRLLEEGELAEAAANLVGSLLLCALGAGAGMAVAGLL